VRNGVIEAPEAPSPRRQSLGTEPRGGRHIEGDREGVSVLSKGQRMPLVELYIDDVLSEEVC